MKTLLEFHNNYLKDVILDENDAHLLNKINLFYHDGKTYLSFSYGDMYPFFTYAESDKELLNIAQKILDHNKEEKNFHYLEISGERKNGDYSIKIDKSIGDRANFSLFYKDKEIGYRIVNFNPVISYLNLDVMTISGGSNIEKKFVGKGLGRFLYETIESVLPYQQIPHGYAGAPGALTDYSKSFWEKRREKQAVPFIDDEVLKKQNHLDYINKIRYTHNPFSLFLKNQDLKMTDYIWNKKSDIVLNKNFFPDYLNDESYENFCLKDIVYNHLHYLKRNIHDYISFDIFNNIVQTSLNDDYIELKDNLKHDFDDLVKEFYKTYYPYNPYPEDINLIDVNFINKKSRVYYQKNGEQYNVGIISSLNYPEDTNYCYQVLKTVNEEGLKTIIKNVKNAEDFFSSDDFVNIKSYESSHLIEDVEFYNYKKMENGFVSRNIVHIGSLQNILDGQYIYVENTVYGNNKISQNKILTQEELKNCISPGFEHLFATENVIDTCLFYKLYKEDKNNIELSIDTILKNKSFYSDENSIYYGDSCFKDSLNKKQFIQELNKLNLECDHLNISSENCYGGYQSKISHKDKEDMLGISNMKDELKM